jgi:DNA polymerase-3 subunit epsilon
MTQRIISFLDIETTGLNEPEHRIIETGVVMYDYDTEEHIRSFVWRCNPQRSIGIKAQKVHGITLADLVNEPTWETVAPAIRGAIEPVFMAVAHNGKYFDFPFIEREMYRVGIHIRMPTLFDTMTEARWATANGKNPRLGELATCLDVPYDPAKAHGSLYDTEVMADCYFAARRIGWFPML